MKRMTVLLLLVCACGSEGAEREAAVSDTTSPSRPVAGLMKGLLSRGSSGLQLIECSGTDTLQLTAGTVDAGMQSDSQFFAIVQLSPSAGGPQLEYIAYKTPDKTDCFVDFSGFDYRATGSNPGWVVEVSGASMKVRHQGGADTVVALTARDSTDAGLALRGAGDRPTVLTLQAQPCRTASTAAESRWTAQLQVRGRVFNGCAIPGVPNR